MKTVGGDPQYASCPQLEKPVKAVVCESESEEVRGLRQLTHRYDSYQGLVARQRKDSVAGSEATSSESSAATDDGAISEHERLQVEAFFRSLKTQVYVCSSLANLYTGSTAHEGNWELTHTGIPVLILDSGETRSRSKRRIQIVLAERGTCFTLWRDTIDNLTSYRVAGRAFHTMHLSSDHTTLVGLSFDSEEAAAEMHARVELLTASPENISLSVPRRGGSKPRRKSQGTPKPPPLPAKANISQPCCFQHITSVDAGDRSRYFSLQTLVPMQSQDQGTEL